jgi:hypothetical protein
MKFGGMDGAFSQGVDFIVHEEKKIHRIKRSMSVVPTIGL